MRNRLKRLALSCVSFAQMADYLNISPGELNYNNTVDIGDLGLLATDYGWALRPH